MRKSDITYLLGSVFMSLTGVFYCCTIWFSIKLPRYYPLQRTWKWVKEQGVPSQAWYGMQGFAFLAAAVGTLLVYLILKSVAKERTEIGPRAMRFVGVIAVLVLLVSMGYTLHYEFARWGVYKLICRQ